MCVYIWREGKTERREKGGKGKRDYIFNFLIPIVSLKFTVVFNIINLKVHLVTVS